MSKRKGKSGTAPSIAPLIDGLFLLCVVLLFTEILFAGKNSLTNYAETLCLQIHNFPQKQIKDA